jgi:phosphonate transport system substrate-binding protein
LRFVTFLAPNLRFVYEFISRYVSDQLELSTEMRAGASYHDIVDADVAFLCGLPYVEMTCRSNPPVEPLAAPVLCGRRYAGQPIYFSDVIVHRDSPFQSFADLRGRSWAYNEPHSQSGYGITRQRLIELGETHGYFGRLVEAGWHDTAIRMVASGAVDASAIDSHVLAIACRDQPELADRLRVIDSFGPSPIQPVVVSRRLPQTLKLELRRVLLEMAADAEAVKILEHGLIERFVPVDDSTYDDIRVMLRTAEGEDFLTIR